MVRNYQIKTINNFFITVWKTLIFGYFYYKTLSSRLGTCANLGELQDKKKRKSIVIGNVSLAQCQASTVGMYSHMQINNYWL
jgi:hypothetical protein